MKKQLRCFPPMTNIKDIDIDYLMFDIKDLGNFHELYRAFQSIDQNQAWKARKISPSQMSLIFNLQSEQSSSEEYSTAKSTPSTSP